MSEGFVIRPLRCEQCGAELPVLGQFVTFQCTTCHAYWELTEEGLGPLCLYRALPPDGFDEKELLHLPFWIVPIDGDDLRAQMTGSLEGIMSVKQCIVRTDFEVEPALEIDGLTAGSPELDPAVRKAAFLNEAAESRIAPTAAEVGIVLARISSVRHYYVFVPAFLASNTFAYLKVGRLMTLRQPAFRARRHEGLDHQVLCAMQSEEAAAIIDFVFFATLPESMQMSGDFMKDVRCRAASRPQLVEFPFAPAGASLHCLLGGFHISRRLVEGREAADAAFTT